jgi:hypothetical protein
MTLYVFLGMGDLFFTMIALQLGAHEANPVLNQLQGHGLFEFSKIALTLLVLCIAYRLRRNKVIEGIMSFANVFMASLFVYHVASLALLFI